MNQTTLGALAEWDPPEEDVQAHTRLISAIDQHYPPNWRAWVVNIVSYEDLFGESIGSDDENRLRFALPTIDLACALSNQTLSSLSERKFKVFKRRLLSWPLGRAIIYSPLATTKKVHPDNAYNGFLTHLQKLRPKLISRHDASSFIRANNHEQSSQSDGSTPVTQRKRTHSPESEAPVAHKAPRTTESDSLSEYIRQQNELLSRLVHLSESNSQSIKELQNNKPLTTDDECNSIGNVTPVSNEWRAPSITNDDYQVNDEPSVDKNIHADTEISEVELENELFNSFEATTIESEAKIGAADPALAKQGIHCQRLGTEGWQNIRYADVQKQFQATPVFTNLKTNSLLATVTPQWQSVALLEKMDLCLGAISNGLIQQRQYFTEIFNKASPEVKKHINKNFLAKDSAFRKTSDALLQYTCGKRAEILQQRRAIYKPNNKTLNELLQAILPSPTHLFSEPQLSDLIKEQGGLMKFFPSRFRNPSYKPKNTRREIAPANVAREKRVDTHRRPTFRPHQDRYSSRTTANTTKRQFQIPAGKQRRSRFEGKK